MFAMDFSSFLSWLEEVWASHQPPRWVVVALPLAYAVYKFSTRNFGVFKRLGIKGPQPWPVVGTTKHLMRMGLFEHDLTMKQLYGPVVGTFNGHRPCLLVYDLDMLKTILVKDFNSFRNREAMILDAPYDKFIHMLQDDHWRHVRNSMSPAFTTGKLRKMLQQVETCSESLIDNLQRMADTKEVFDFHDYCGAYTMDVIASTGFGLQIDSHNDPNNPFVRYSKEIFSFNVRSRKAILLILFPFLIKPLGKFGIRLFPSEITNFFIKAVNDAVDLRKSSTADGGRVDLLQLIINAEADPAESSSIEDTAAGESDWSAVDADWKPTRQGLTHDEVVSQGIFFLVAGYETTANTLSFVGYSLAVNDDCQDKLIAEIDDVMQGQEHVTYDVIQRMPYLDMCVSETLRMYPAGPRTDRIAAADTVVKGVTIPKGMVINVPIYALHHDPEYWSEPEKFYPERFLPDAKAKRNPYCYMPFGMGPHNCLGMRLALMEIKVAVVHILQKFRFVACEETQVPLKLEKLRMRAEGGIKLRMEPRRKHL